jgi:hypothetical protein
MMSLAGGDPVGALGAGMVGLYLPLIEPVLEASIRRVTLTISWKVGTEDISFDVICFFTDTKAISQMAPGAQQP